LLFETQQVRAQALRDPVAGEIYKEFAHAMIGGLEWRVTDPNSTRPILPGPSDDPRDFLVNCPDASNPQSVCQNIAQDITLGDLAQAVRADAVMDVWSGHPGTTPKQFVFNDYKTAGADVPSWLTIPEISGVSHPQCYMSQRNISVDVPLAQLKQGPNIFRGLSGPQTKGVPGCGNFNWGQWGWYSLVTRVYYNPATKPHTRGRIVSPAPCSVMGPNPTISVETAANDSVTRVDVFAYYAGFDASGNGGTQRYHHSIRTPSTFQGGKRTNASLMQEVQNWEKAVPLSHHVGTKTTAPFTFTWDTTDIPDQPVGSVKLIARIRDSSGVYYVTEEVKHLTLQRNGSSLKAYAAQDVPLSFWVRGAADQPDKHTKTSKFMVPSDAPLSTATAASMRVATWNALSLDKWAINVHAYTRPDNLGRNHYYALDTATITPSHIVAGLNTVSFTDIEEEHHGTELLWPGPSMFVTYAANGLLPASGVDPSLCAANPPDMDSEDQDDDQDQDDDSSQEGQSSDDGCNIRETHGGGSHATFLLVVLGFAVLQWRKRKKSLPQ